MQELEMLKYRGVKAREVCKVGKDLIRSANATYAYFYNKRTGLYALK
jgi:hypothetical protein